MKWVFVALFGVLGVGLLGFGVYESFLLPRHEPPLLQTARLAVRPLPSMPNDVPLKAPAAAPPTNPAPVTPAPAPTGATPPEAPKPAPAPTGPAPAPVPAPAPAPVAPPAAAPAPVAPKPAPAPAPPAAAPKPTPAPAAPKPAAPADGRLTLEASDSAEVMVDGKRVGSSPVRNFKVRPGVHKVRFDCNDAEGNSVTGPMQNVTVTSDAEAVVKFTCPQ